MERVLFAKIEVWIVALIAILGLVGAVIFAAIAVKEAERSDDSNSQFPILGPIALEIASIPENAEHAFSLVLGSDGDTRAFVQLDPSIPEGWSSVGGAYAKLEGYILLSRYNGDEGHHQVELYDLETATTVFVWHPDAANILAGFQVREEFDGIADGSKWNNRLFRYIHPIPTVDGGLILKDHQAPVFKISACGALEWKIDDTLFHHSTEPDGQGNIYVPGYITPPSLERLGIHFHDDSMTLISEDGEVLWSRSLTDVLIKSGYGYMLFPSSGYYEDPIHLNDIQPVLSDGKFWRKGDLFLSMRTFSALALYRPSEDRIVWLKHGPWRGQHDIEIINDHTIGVFSNNAFNMGKGTKFGTASIFLYDFRTDTTREPLKKAFEDLNLRTLSEGLFDTLPGGYVMVEQENAGRLVVLSETGEPVRQFVNMGTDGATYRMGWSRYIDKSNGDQLKTVLASADCGND